MPAWVSVWEASLCWVCCFLHFLPCRGVDPGPLHWEVSGGHCEGLPLPWLYVTPFNGSRTYHLCSFCFFQYILVCSTWDLNICPCVCFSFLMSTLCTSIHWRHSLPCHLFSPSEHFSSFSLSVLYTDLLIFLCPLCPLVDMCPIKY